LARQRCQFHLDRCNIGIERLIEEAALFEVELLTARGELQPPEHRDLMRELRVARILEADLAVLLCDLLHQLRGERAQLVCVEGVQVDRGVHRANVPETLATRRQAGLRTWGYQITRIA
jgi:hypothetical protein